MEHRAVSAQAEAIVNACHAYAKDHGQLPEGLSRIVPDYLSSLLATLGLIASKPYYYVPPQDGRPASFMYVPESFTRSWYNFDTREWKSHAT